MRQISWASALLLAIGTFGCIRTPLPTSYGDASILAGWKAGAVSE